MKPEDGQCCGFLMCGVKLGCTASKMGAHFGILPTLDLFCEMVCFLKWLILKIQPFELGMALGKVNDKPEREAMLALFPK